jgi:hypothetical protein
MDPVHAQVLDAALTQTDAAHNWEFRLAHVLRALPQLNQGTVRTHIASRCCVNAPSNHQSRHGYFRAIGRGTYQIEPPFRRTLRRSRPSAGAWQDRLLEAVDSGVDPTLIAESLKVTPTKRLLRMQEAAESLDAMKRR